LRLNGSRNSEGLSLKPQKVDDIYRPQPSPLWRVPDALASMGRRLPELLGAGLEGASLWRFLPGPAALEAAGLGLGTVRDTALLCRSVVASTLIASLELARRGELKLAQEENFGAIQVHAGDDRPTASITSPSSDLIPKGSVANPGARRAG